MVIEKIFPCTSEKTKKQIDEKFKLSEWFKNQNTNKDFYSWLETNANPEKKIKQISK